MLTFELMAAHSWSPLHLASLLSTPPLVSFLLTRGCSPSWMTNKGLTALDIVEGMPGRENVADLLTGVGEAAALITPNPNGHDESPWAQADPLHSSLDRNDFNDLPKSLEQDLTSTPMLEITSPHLSISTEEANKEYSEQDTSLQTRRLQALERHRRMKRACRERFLRREQQVAENEHIDASVRTRLLGMDMDQDEVQCVMRAQAEDGLLKKSAAVNNGDSSSDEEDDEVDDVEDDEDDTFHFQASARSSMQLTEQDIENGMTSSVPTGESESDHQVEVSCHHLAFQT